MAGTGLIEFRLLGEIEAVRYGTPLPLGGGRQRRLLAILLLEPGRPVAVDRLAEELWQGEVPAAAAATLRTYVSKLRGVLGGHAQITGGGAGYALDVAPEQVDARRFEQLVGEGGEALRRHAPRRAAERLRKALELWQGRPFGELGDDGALRLEAERLEELRLLALEDLVQADLELGQAAELVDELEALVHANPFRERLWRQLMLALYRADRQADALAAYRRLRTVLDEELGLEPGEEAKSLEQAILRHEVLPAQRPGERQNLPAPLSSFVGRGRELEELERLLRASRLVTLTGVGGAGKTRLALEAAARALADLPDGVCFVDLSGLGDPTLVSAEVATALELRPRPDAPLAGQLEARLREAELLLVLDNCEHLRAACAELAHRLLAASPGLRVLATSRELLGVPGEVDFVVPPLAEANELFLARAREARPGLRLDEGSAEIVERICVDLDGLPLAIELAAARAKALSLEEIARRLSDRFRFLVSWRRLTTARHRTLEEAMSWSYELLADEERTLLARLSIFAGGFTLAAAAEVCLEGDDGRALETLQHLVEASLVVPEERDGAMRYRLLETVRQYAAARLPADDETEVRRRHAEWALALAERAEPELTGGEQSTWFGVLETEHDNLRAALSHLATVGDPDLRLRLTTALTRFWYVRGHLGEARAWLERALAADGGTTTDLRRRALTAGAAMALLQGDYAVATSFAEQSLAVARATEEDRFVANALSNLGAIVLAAGDHDRAAELLEEAVPLAREVGDERIMALAINNLGDLALTTGDYGRAGPLFQESLELLRARGDTANVARALFNVGAVALQCRRPDEARRSFHEAVGLAREAGDKEDLAWCMEGFAALAAAAGEGQRAALLLGAAGALLEEMGAAFKPFERRLHEATESLARELCGEDAYAAAAARGAGLTLEDALEQALSG